MTSDRLHYFIQQSMRLSNIDSSTFYQINRIFNINPESLNDANSKSFMENKLKSKIFDILNTQGQNYKDYLKLPKFNILKPQTLQKLYSLFNRIWCKFAQQIETQKKEKEIQQIQIMIPQFKTLQDIENFHLQLLNDFKLSSLCPMNQVNLQKKQKKKYLQEKVESENYFKRQKDHIYPTNLLNTNNSNKVFPKIEDDPKDSNNLIWNDNKYIGLEANFPIPNSEANFPIPNQKQFKSYEQKSRTNKYNSYMQNSAPLVNDDVYSKVQMLFKGQQNQLLDKLQEYMFIQCPCQGKIAASHQYMNCKTCYFSFHFQCLLTEKNYNQQICPSCKLSQGSNVFMKIYQQPVAKRWFKNLKAQRLNFFLTQKQIDILKRNKQLCKPSSDVQYQLRFQKLKRSNQNISNGRNQNKARQYNSLPLPPSYIQNVKPLNMFQINIKTENSRQDSEEFLFFFAIFLVQKFNEQNTVNQFFSSLNDSNSVGQSYLKNYLQQKQFIDISMKDRLTQNEIRYPVRGNNCQHSQVFDYLSILLVNKQYGQRFKALYCPQCDNICNEIIGDKFIYEKIRKLEEDDNEEEGRVLRYYGNGQVKWNAQDENQESQIEDNNEQQQQSMSESMS